MNTKLKYFLLGVAVTLFIIASIDYNRKQDAKVKADKAQCIKTDGKWHRHSTPDGYTDVHCGDWD